MWVGWVHEYRNDGYWGWGHFCVFCSFYLKYPSSNSLHELNPTVHEPNWNNIFLRKSSLGKIYNFSPPSSHSSTLPDCSLNALNHLHCPCYCLSSLPHSIDNYWRLEVCSSWFIAKAKTPRWAQSIFLGAGDIDKILAFVMRLTTQFGFLYHIWSSNIARNDPRIQKLE